MDSDARGNYQELLPLKLITIKRDLLPETEGDSFFASAGGIWRGREDRWGVSGGTDGRVTRGWTEE